MKTILELAASKGITLHPSLLAEYPVGTPFYALHHNEPSPVEFLTEPLINRVRFVLDNKPPHELAVRLAAMRPVLGKLPAAYDTAWAAYDTAWAAVDTAWAPYDTARAAYDTARAAYAPSLIAQWDEEYPDHPKWTVEAGLTFP